MPTNHTANYQLNQWVKSDQVKMEDFNADNAKIDAALNTQAQTLTAHTAELARKGNCLISLYTYTGNGRLGEANPTVIPFSKGTFLLIIMTQLGTFQHILPGTQNIDWVEEYSGRHHSPITWSATSMSIYSDRNAAYQFNNSNTEYTVLSFRMAGNT